jgi:hypothetical protein
MDHTANELDAAWMYTCSRVGPITSALPATSVAVSQSHQTLLPHQF